MEGSEAKNFFKAWGIVLASLCYCYYIPSRIPKGKLRFFSLLPIITLFTLLPLSLSRPLPSLILTGFITWLTNFKLFLYSFNQGPLSTNQSQKSIIWFIFFAAFPIKIKEKLSSSDLVPSNNRVVPLNWGAKVMTFTLLHVMYTNITTTKSHNRDNLVLLLLCCLIYLFVDIAMGACDLVVGPILGLELDPPSDQPFLSTSLQEFWGRRWNRTMSDILRHAVYKPVKSMTRKLLGLDLAHVVAIMATFIVSGLMHEFINYYTTRVRPTWEVTWFFVLHGVCVVLEILVKRVLGQRWRLHWAVSGPLTIGFITGTAFWLFFPQIMRNNLDSKVSEDILVVAKYLRDVMRLN